MTSTTRCDDIELVTEDGAAQQVRSRCHTNKVSDISMPGTSVEVMRGNGALATIDINALKNVSEAASKATVRKRSVRRFYKLQNELIDQLHDDETRVSDAFPAPVGSVAFPSPGGRDDPSSPINPESKEKRGQLVIQTAVYGSFGVNVSLFLLKLVAAILSGSIAVIASTADSLLDLVSGVVISWTQRAMERTDPYTYPQGKARLEPIGVTVFAVVMAMSSLQIIAEAVKRLVAIVFTGRDALEAGVVTYSILATTIISKAALYVFCSKVSKTHGSTVAEALAQDHWNDVATNSIGVAAVVLAVKVPGHLGFVDPVGAILIAGWILYSWVCTALEQVRKLAGKAAPPGFLQRLTHIAFNHDARILKVDTVRAYHFGERFLVEIDIVLPEQMPLRETHDIGEALQFKIEALEEVERAFVHIDWEWDHRPGVDGMRRM